MKKVFLIDDDIDDRDMFRQALKTLDTEIEYVEAKDGQEALEMVADINFSAPDVMFVDLNMPRVTGLEFVIRVKQLSKYQDIPTYIYTTSASPRERVNCIAAGATGYIIKQVRSQDLATELKGIMANLSMAKPSAALKS